MEVNKQVMKINLLNDGNITDDLLKKNLLLPLPQRAFNTNDKIATVNQTMVINDINIHNKKIENGT